ncbi:hypothetical protein LTR94_036954, partial [Friedmanniomyces endolithicus]
KRISSARTARADLERASPRGRCKARHVARSPGLPGQGRRQRRTLEPYRASASPLRAL